MSKSWKNIELLLNKEFLLGIFILLLIFWSLFYLIPGVLILIFNSFLGILLILLATILISLQNLKIGITFGLICLILMRMTLMVKEGHGKPYDGGTKEKFNFDN